MIALADRTWVLDAACAKTGLVDMWASTCTQADVARHVCLQHCPVLAQCEAEVARYAGKWDSYRDVTVAGVTYNGTGRPVADQRVRRACWLCSGMLPKPELTFHHQRPTGDVHGTSVGLSRHREAREPMCDACKAWRRAEDQRKRAAAR